MTGYFRPAAGLLAAALLTPAWTWSAEHPEHPKAVPSAAAATSGGSTSSSSSSGASGSDSKSSSEPSSNATSGSGSGPVQVGGPTPDPLQAAPAAPRVETAPSPDAGGVFRSPRIFEESPGRPPESSEPAPPEASEQPARSMSLPDARLNFESVFNTHVSRKRRGGALPIPATEGGGITAVVVDGLDKASVSEAGSGQYSAIAKGRLQKGGRAVLLRVVADLSGSRWFIKEISLLPDDRNPGDPARARALYSAAVLKHINFSSDNSRSGGAFVVPDELLKRDWRLKLNRIHEDRIVSLGRGRFFACADFRSEAGAQTVDLDFYAVESSGGWSVERVLIHKVSGVPRFIYNEDNEIVPAP